MVLSRPLHQLRTLHRLGGWQHLLKNQLLRYILVGGGITVAAHLVYLLLLALGLGPHTAWLLSFVFGTSVGYVLHRRLVFRAQARRHHWLTFPATYVLRFWIGQGLLGIALWLGFSPGWAGLIVNLLMAPIGFVMLRLVLRDRR